MRKVMVKSVFGILLLWATEIQARLITIESFEDFLSGTQFVQSVRMTADYENEIADNLMIRDPITGGDSIVSGCYHMGFIHYQSDIAYVVGYGENRDRGYNGWGGYMAGVYVKYTKSGGVTYTLLETGQRPDDIWFIYDGNENGIGHYNTANAIWTMGDDDILYTSKDILFGAEEIRGDVSQLPVVGGESNILPHMVIYLVPEPTALLLLGLGSLLFRKRLYSI